MKALTNLQGGHTQTVLKVLNVLTQDLSPLVVAQEKLAKSQIRLSTILLQTIVNLQVTTVRVALCVRHQQKFLNGASTHMSC